MMEMEKMNEEILDILEYETIRRRNLGKITDREQEKIEALKLLKPKLYEQMVDYIEVYVPPRLEEEETFVIDDPENLVGFIIRKHMDEDDWYVGDVFEKIVREGTVVGKYASRFTLDPNTKWWDMLEEKYKSTR